MKVEKVAVEPCGMVAKNRVMYADGKVIWLCARHFSNRDVQNLMTHRWIEREYVDDTVERCEAEVMRAKKKE